MPQSDKTLPLKRLNAEADASHAGDRLDRFLSARLPELSRTRVQSLIKEGHVSSGRVTIMDVKYRVKPGDRFELTVPPPQSATPEAQALEQKIDLQLRILNSTKLAIDFCDTRPPDCRVVAPGATYTDGLMTDGNQMPP